MLYYFYGDFKSIVHGFLLILLFFRRDHVNGQTCISPLPYIDIVAKIFYKGTHLDTPLGLKLANTSSLAVRSKVFLWGIWANPQLSLAHLLTPPSPNPAGFGPCPNSMLDT